MGCDAAGADLRLRIGPGLCRPEVLVRVNPTGRDPGWNLLASIFPVECVKVGHRLCQSDIAGGLEGHQWFY